MRRENLLAHSGPQLPLGRKYIADRDPFWRDTVVAYCGATMPKKVKPGDVAEVVLNRGFGYVQMVLDHKGPPSYGQLIRVFPGSRKKRPTDLAALVRAEEQFVTFLPLNILVTRGLLAVIGNEPIPKGKEKVPLFKCQGAMSTETWHTEVWWVWNGRGEGKNVGAVLTEAQQAYPTGGVINLPLLVERIETDYKPIDDWIESERRRTTPGRIVFENDLPKWVPLEEAAPAAPPKPQRKSRRTKS